MAGEGMGVNTDYLRTATGIIKIISMVFAIIVAGICTIDVFFFENEGGGWIIFVAIVGLLSTLVLFMLNLLSVWSTQANWRHLLEFIHALVLVIFYFISGTIAAAHAPGRDPAIGATAFFCFANLLLHGIDAFLMFMMWRAGGHDNAPATSTTTTQRTHVTISTTQHSGHQNMAY